MSGVNVEGLTGLMEGLDELRQACAAHRRVFLDEGFSETAAEAMTIEFHARLLRGA